MVKRREFDIGVGNYQEQDQEVFLMDSFSVPV